MKACSICTEPFDKYRRVIRCDACRKECCLVCFEKFVLESNTSPKCMFCDSAFDLEFLYENMSKVFMKKLRKRDMQLLIDKEKGMLIDTQKYVEYNTLMRKSKDEMDAMSVKIESLNATIKGIEEKNPIKFCPKCKSESVYYLSKYCYDCMCKICLQCRRVEEDGHVCDERDIGSLKLYIECINERSSLIKQKNVIKERITLWEKRYVMVHDDDKLIESKDILCACPKYECNGYVRKDNNACNLCSTIICELCFTIKTENHVCNSNDVKSMTLIKKSTKNCPKCSMPIEKIDGCNQMWCTSCNNAFNWLSGKPEMGAVHNPHYFEWLRHIDGVNIELDRYVEGIPDARHFETHIECLLKKTCNKLYTLMLSLFRLMSDIQNTILTEDVAMNELRTNLDLRLLWINNEITTEQWGTMLHKRYKLNKVKKSRDKVLTLFIRISSGISNRLMSCNDYINANQLFGEWEHSVWYTNKCFKKLSEVLLMRMPYITCEGTKYGIKMKYNYTNVNL